MEGLGSEHSYGTLMEQKPANIPIPPRGTKGTNMPGGAFLMRLAKPLMDRQVDGLRRAPGPEPKVAMGLPVLLLTTVGAKSGIERTHVLGGFADGPDAWLVVASKSGAATHPAWFINLAKNPDKVWIQVGNRKMHARVESLAGADRENAYARVVAVAPRYADYLKKTDREIPVLRITPAS
jgi:deazaflavin-dependent oxidoreductase (nitroreductase family)